MSKQKIAIVPGSFDPITKGHVDIVKRTLLIYDKVVLAVMINPDKKYMFTLDERKKIAESALKDIENVVVISSDGMLWELAKKLGAVAIVKGYRNQIDYDYELTMADYNQKMYPSAQTVLLKAAEDLVNISSTVVRNEIKNGNFSDSYLPEGAITEIKNILKNKTF